MARKFIIDADVGMDDASAIFIAAEAHKTGVIEIAAITAVHGNTSIDNVVINLDRTLKCAKLNQIPIYKGAYEPLVERQENPKQFHGIDGFGDAVHEDEADLSSLQTEHAVNALVRLVKENPGQITLVALGPLTNVAMAIRMDAEFASNLKAFYIMGGNTEGVGNITVSAEFNFHSDPEAAFIVLSNVSCPTYIAPWELCLLKTSLEWDWRLNIYGAVDSPQGRLINLIEAKMIERRPYRTYVACDQLAIAAAIDPSCILLQSAFYVTVELNGKNTRGQMIVDRSGHLMRPPNVFLIEGLDVDLLKTMMVWSLGDESVLYNPPLIQ